MKKQYNIWNTKTASAAVIIAGIIISLILAGCGKAMIQEPSPMGGPSAAAKAGETSPDGQTGEPSPSPSTGEPSPSLSTGEPSPSSPSPSTGEPSPSESSPEVPAKEAEFPLKVTDGNGFEMTIENEPQRIVSITLGSDEMLLGLVDKSRIIALSRYAKDDGISNVPSEAAGIVEMAVMDKVERVIALMPDLVVLDTWADANVVRQLRESGINVYAYKTPNNIAEQRSTIIEIAHVVGADAKGGEIVDWMDKKLKDIEDRLARLKPEQKLTVMDYGEMGSSGKGTNFDDIVTRAGLVNVVSEAGIEGWPLLSKEKIIEFNPDIIILPSWYFDPANSFEGMANTLRSDESLQSVNAISRNRIISLPNQHISAISQYVVLAVEDAARAVYPELFE